MPDMATIPERQTSLNELAHCSVCGTTMALIGDNYVCPVNAERASDRCHTTPVNAGALVRAVATQLLKRVMTDDTVIMLTEDFQQSASEISNMQQRRLQNSEASITDLDKLKQQVLRPVELKLAIYPDVAQEVDRINATRMGLAYESQVAQDELDKLAFISDPEGLKNDAHDITSWLDDVDPEQTKALLSIFVREIRVGPDSAEVLYSHPLPDEQGHARVTSDLIPLAR
jgi:hypothetical protein